MTKRQYKNIGASIRQRLLSKARETGRSFSELLQYFAMERFLYRLSKSSYADNFILKGALMLTVWKAPLTRPTMDIDFLGRIENSVETLVKVTREICQQEVELHLYKINLW
jgi:predicted nucleotidyltransferase component of viral defense system